MKKVLSVIAAAAVAVSALTACSAQPSKEKSEAKGDGAGLHTVYFKNQSKSDGAVATFFNSDSGERADVEMTKVAEDGDSVTFSCEGDASAYNMMYFNYNNVTTNKVAFNRCVSGWYNSERGFLPYTEGEPIDFHYNYEHVSFTFMGYQKDIHIWTPDDYDAASSEKYGTIYLLDGEIESFLLPDGTPNPESEYPAQQVRSMTAATGYRSIIVAVDTLGDMIGFEYGRFDELVPDIGEPADFDETTQKTGSKFADFLADTVVPYIQKNYNVYTEPRHVAVTGTSLGGLEAFYIALEHPDVFGNAGALSASFWVFDDATWRKFLSGKPFDETAPFLYIYTGNAKDDTGDEVNDMVDRLRDMGYPKDRMAFHYNDKGAHAAIYWRSIFSEFLEALAFREVAALKKQ